MYKGIELSASVMCIDWLNTSEQIKELIAEKIDFLHYDILDGRFAPDFTLGSSIINRFRTLNNFASDYHFMADEPSAYFDNIDFSDNPCLAIHQESSRNLHRDLVKIRQLGGIVGVALSPATTLSSLEYIIEELDYVLLMTVNPGYMGQSFVPQVVKKVENLSTLSSNLNLDLKISVDGNINKNTIPDLVSAGATRLVLGSSGLFMHNKSINIADAMDNIYSAIDSAV